MILTCLRENLLSSLNIVFKAISAKAPDSPVYATILFTAQNGRLKLVATDQATTIITYCNASIDEEGSICVPAKVIKEYLSSISTEQVLLKATADILTLEAGKSSSKINGLDANDFPKLPEYDLGTNFILLDPKELIKGLSYVNFCIPLEDTRPVFNGIYIFYTAKMLTLVGTDGFRLSEILIPAVSELEEFKLLIPGKVLFEASKMFSGENEIKIYKDSKQNNAIIQGETTVVITRTISGDFPAYKKIIPADFTLTAVVKTAPLLEALKVANVFIKNDNSDLKIVTIDFDPKENNLKLYSPLNETGEAVTTIDAQLTCENTIKADFKINFLLDLINNAKAEEITIKGNNANSTFIIVANEIVNFLHLVVPLQKN